MSPLEPNNNVPSHSSKWAPKHDSEIHKNARTDWQCWSGLKVVLSKVGGAVAVNALFLSVTLKKAGSLIHCGVLAQGLKTTSVSAYLNAKSPWGFLLNIVLIILRDKIFKPGI